MAVSGHGGFMDEIDIFSSLDTEDAEKLRELKENLEEMQKIENQIGRIIHNGDITDEDEEKLLEVARDLELIGDDVKNLDQALNDLIHLNKKHVEELNSMIDRIEAETEGTQKDLMKMLKQLKRQNVTQEFLEEDFKDVAEGKSKEIRKLTEEIDKALEVAEILAREINREGNYEMTALREEKQALKELGVITSITGNRQIKDAASKLFNTFRKESDQQFKLYQSEEELAEEITEVMDELLEVIATLESDIEQINQEIEPYTSKVYTADFEELHRLGKVEKKLEDSRMRAEQVKEDLDKDWSEIESEADSLPKILQELEFNYEEESIDIDFSIKQPIETYKKRSKRAAKKYRILRPNLERLLEILSEREKVLILEGDHEEIVTGLEASRKLGDILEKSAGVLFYMRSNIGKYHSGSKADKQFEIWVSELSEEGIPITEYGFTFSTLYIRGNPYNPEQGNEIEEWETQKSLRQWLDEHQEVMPKGILERTGNSFRRRLR